MSHVDESGAPCVRHPEVAPARLYELAMLGSRMRSFNHEIASKLQSLVMAIDEANELVGKDSPLHAAIGTATAALRELRELLDGNRALAKPTLRAVISVHELLERAGDRSGVALRGQLDTCEVRVAVSAMTHAFAQLLDLAAGPGLRRVVDVSIAHGDTAVISIVGTEEPPKGVAIGEMIALAAHAIDREDGSLACGANGFTVRLPVAADSAVR
ncbi:MAG TPA: hypothetical protein VMJ10_20580 [Kofleriaceae bacterium]|nr:hypothetical protein [Kofleriaceae bacterium]